MKSYFVKNNSKIKIKNKISAVPHKSTQTEFTSKAADLPPGITAGNRAGINFSKKVDSKSDLILSKLKSKSD